jgi:hypothetical protein
VQRRHGADRLAVALLSVDPEYFGKNDSYVLNTKELFEKQRIDWPNAFVPGGWGDVMRTFNLSGYGNVVVDANGVVRGVNIHGEELERLIRSLIDGEAGRPPRSKP